jgi:hypothetical protein
VYTHAEQAAVQQSRFGQCTHASVVCRVMGRDVTVSVCQPLQIACIVRDMLCFPRRASVTFADASCRTFMLMADAAASHWCTSTHLTAYEILPSGLDEVTGDLRNKHCVNLLNVHEKTSRSSTAAYLVTQTRSSCDGCLYTSSITEILYTVNHRRDTPSRSQYCTPLAVRRLSYVWPSRVVWWC